MRSGIIHTQCGVEQTKPLLGTVHVVVEKQDATCEYIDINLCPAQRLGWRLPFSPVFLLSQVCP